VTQGAEGQGQQGAGLAEGQQQQGAGLAEGGVN